MKTFRFGNRELEKQIKKQQNIIDHLRAANDTLEEKLRDGGWKFKVEFDSHGDEFVIADSYQVTGEGSLYFYTGGFLSSKPVYTTTKDWHTVTRVGLVKE